MSMIQVANVGIGICGQEGMQVNHQAQTRQDCLELCLFQICVVINGVQYHRVATFVFTYSSVFPAFAVLDMFLFIW